ncbi:hypothetical protein CRUP_023215 [Coryphaenoides rupestris]|nr:hypothetical protein CRUP_023215 [Coryphaenoides rupestris]
MEGVERGGATLRATFQRATGDPRPPIPSSFFASPQSTPSFGALANQSAPPSFGGLAQQSPGFGAPQGGGVFGGFGQQQQQQPQQQQQQHSSSSSSPKEVGPNMFRQKFSASLSLRSLERCFLV